MSETETAVPMDDKALFDAATSDAATETPVTEAQEDSGQPRDEGGRFASKVEKAEEVQEPVQAEQVQKPDSPAQVPAWRVSEIAEARRAAEARAAENERRAQELELQNRRLSGQLRQYTEKPQEPIDPFGDPEKFADQRARQAVDPVIGQVDSIREYYSRKDAIRTHGEETVNAAYDWIAKVDRSGGPNGQAFIQRVKASIDPFEEIVSAYKRDKAFTTVGDDPNAWFEKELERRISTDPEFKNKLGQPQSATPASIVKLPPSLNRQPGSAGNEPPTGIDDKSLYEFATR